MAIKKSKKTPKVHGTYRFTGTIEKVVYELDGFTIEIEYVDDIMDVPDFLNGDKHFRNQEIFDHRRTRSRGMNIPYNLHGTIRDMIASYLSLHPGNTELIQDVGDFSAWLESEPENDSQPVAPEPDWSTVPDYLVWRTIDADGTEEYWRRKPIRSDSIGSWYFENIDDPDSEMLIGNKVDLPLGIDWRTTLTQRPMEP